MLLLIIGWSATMGVGAKVEVVRQKVIAGSW